MATMRLAYWLGRWSTERAPDVERRAMTLWAGAPVSYVYRPHRSPAGAWLVSPGLHWRGPEDPRVDRLARILASTGYLVLSPAIPDLIDLRLTSRAIEALITAYDTLNDEMGQRAAILSLSVGSLCALRLAAARRVTAVVLFGGFADPFKLLRSLIVEPQDPLNQPVVFLTLARRLPVDATAREAVCAAWRRQVQLTWPRPELKTFGSTAHHQTALEIAATLPERVRDTFLIGCGVKPGGWDLCRSLLDSREFDFLDPRPWLDAVRCPVHVMHGVDDRVIPFEQQRAIVDALPSHVPVSAYSAQFFGHSGVATGTGRVWRLARDARMLVRLLHTLATCPRGGAT